MMPDHFFSHDHGQGFSLIELLISMVIAMVLLAGLYGNFIMQSRVQNAQSGVVEASEDLRIAAQIMQGEMRLANAICWDAGNTRLIYRPFGSAVALPGPCNAVDASHGTFRFNASAICWDRPNDGSGCQELVRNLNAATGLQVTPTGNGNLGIVRSVILTSTYKDHEKQDKDWDVRFDIFPRN